MMIKIEGKLIFLKGRVGHADLNGRTKMNCLYIFNYYLTAVIEYIDYNFQVESDLFLSNV